MDLMGRFITPEFSCNKSSYSLREYSLVQIFKLMYNFFYPSISNGKLMIDPPYHLGGDSEPYCLRRVCLCFPPCP
jgi:hypothetical protein